MSDHQQKSDEVPAVEWAIALHGGAGTIARNTDEQTQREYREALAEALEVGRAILADGGSSLDAVEAVVRNLEDNPLFNAGRGAVFNSDGENEMDACIMDGATLRSGAVASVQGVRNPITLARFVMERTPHVLFAGVNAHRLAAENGIELAPAEYFHTPMRHERWLRTREAERVGSEAGEIERGTVGAVARDIHGNLAAATSTGGRTNKMPGRVGDSPLAGIGNYANNATLAMSCTGDGEKFIRQTAAFHVSALMQYGGRSLDAAMRHLFHELLEPGSGGAVAVDAHGRIVMEFTTRGMYRGAADANGRFEVAIWED